MSRSSSKFQHISPSLTLRGSIPPLDVDQAIKVGKRLFETITHYVVRLSTRTSTLPVGNTLHFRSLLVRSLLPKWRVLILTDVQHHVSTDVQHHVSRMQLASSCKERTSSSSKTGSHDDGVPDPLQLSPVQRLSVRIIVGLRVDFQAAKPAPQDHEIVAARGVAQASWVQLPQAEGHCDFIFVSFQ